MRAPTIVMSESAFDHWRAEQERALQGGQG
jgi:hypothetical protein